jgi:hypothetical protein
MNANLALYVVVTIAESIIPQQRKLQIAAQQSYVMVKPQIGVVVHPVNSVDLEGEIVISESFLFKSNSKMTILIIAR